MLLLSKKLLIQIQLERLKDGNIHMCFSSRSGYSNDLDSLNITRPTIAS